MKKEELVDALHELSTDDDTEDAHIKADELLLKYINDDEINEAFHSIDKWYA